MPLIERRERWQAASPQTARRRDIKVRRFILERFFTFPAFPSWD